MNPLLRFVPAAVVVLMFLIKMFSPDFLAAAAFTVPWTTWGVPWFWLIVLPVGYLAAYLITPPFVALINRVSTRAFLPFIFFIALLVSGLWLVDLTYNHTVGAWCETCPDSNLLSMMTAVFGGA